MTATIPDWVSVRFIRLGLVKMGPVDHLTSSLVKCRIPTTPTPLPRITEVNFLGGGLRSCSFNKLPRWFLFLNWRKWSESESEVTQSCPTLCDPMVYNLHQAPSSIGFSRQEYWSGLPFPSPGDLPNPGIEPRSPTLQADVLPSEPPGKPNWRTTRLTTS